MNQYQADLYSENPVATLRNDNCAAITTRTNSISYIEFNTLIRKVASTLALRGVTNKDRVIIVGDSKDFIASIVWTYAAMYLGASPGNASDIESIEDIQGKAKAAHARYIVWTDGRTMCLELDNSAKARRDHRVHSFERYVLFSSGTTKKPEGKFGCEPQFFTYHTRWAGGIAHQDQINLAYRFLGEVPINQIACHGWEVAYAPHNVVQCLLTGGTYHHVDTPEDMWLEQKRKNTNLISNYPLSYDPIVDAWWQNKDQGIAPIEVVDVAGGICTPELIVRIRETISPRVITNSFISSKSGTILHRVIDEDDDPELCVWMENPHANTRVELHLDSEGVLYYRRMINGWGPWITDGDKFEQDGKYYRCVGKKDDEFLSSGISTWEVENWANQLTRTHWGCGEHTYCFPMEGLDGYDGHGLVYSGPLDILQLHNHMGQMSTEKQPDRIYQVDPSFWALDIKISRDWMSSRLNIHRNLIEKWT